MEVCRSNTNHSNVAMSDSATVMPNMRKRKPVQTEVRILRSTCLIIFFFNDRIVVFSSCHFAPDSTQYMPFYLRNMFNICLTNVTPGQSSVGSNI